MPFIVESIVTTVDTTGLVNVAPMGIYWGTTTVLLKPYQSTTTYHNLRDNLLAVINLTDDANLIGRAAVSVVTPPLVALQEGRAYRLEDCCSYHVVEVQQCDATSERAEVRCRIVERGHIRDFVGFNRAHNAILEAAILATRVHLLGTSSILPEFDRFAAIVEKTGLSAEKETLRFLRSYVESNDARAR